MAGDLQSGPFKTLGPAEASRSDFVIFASGKWPEKIAAGNVAFFNKIAAALPHLQAKPEVITLDHPDCAKLLRRTDITKIAIGPILPKGKGLFFANPSYVHGFWYLDPQGVHWNSTLCDMAFEPERIDAEAARYFFNGVASYMLAENVSPRQQSRRSPTPLPQAEAAIFIQNIEGYAKRAHYLTTAKMLENTAKAMKGLVYVKMHPLMDDLQRQSIRDMVAQHPNLLVSEASIHDLITASNRVVSQNSAVGFEALMHKKPVLTCGKSDYHHASLVCRTAKDLRQNLHAAPGHFASFPFEKYFYWFLGIHMLEPAKPDFAERALSRLTSQE